MHIDLKWASVSLLPSTPYSVCEQSRFAVLGLAFERQVGVHAIGGEPRSDFDAWPGELAVSRPDVDVFSESERGGEYLTVHFAKLDEDEELFKPPARPRVVMHGDRQALMAGMKLRRLLFSSHAQYLDIEEQAAILLSGSLVRLRPLGRSDACPNRARKIHPRIFDYIEQALTGPLVLTDLAQVAGMPKLRFLRSFTDAVGATPHAYVTERRLQRARALLKTSDDSIASIAADCGFAHQSHLGALLQGQIGLTPGQYRSRSKLIDCSSTSLLTSSPTLFR